MKNYRSKRMIFIVSVLLTTLLVACSPGAKSTPVSTLPTTNPPATTATSTATSTLEPTSTYTTTAIASATATFVPPKTTTPTQTPQVASCPGAPELKLKLDHWAMVSKDPPIPNKIHSQPEINSETIGNVQPGETMLVEDGPRCADGYAWWYVDSFNGLEGWTAEGDAEGYWILPLMPVSADWSAFQNPITLTADQVHSASDIEAAIKSATAEGKRPGTVILDGRDGAFVFKGSDRSVKIRVSDLTLIGVNEAVIKNCDTGLNFDNIPIKNILVEGIEFICTGNGVWSRSENKSVVLRNNIFRTGSIAINLYTRSSDWLITYNLIEAYGGGIEIIGSERIVISNNHMTSNIGITMRSCSDAQVRKNNIHASDQGIQLLESAWRNLVEMNNITAGQTGITMNVCSETQVRENTIHATYQGLHLLEFVRRNLIELNTILGVSQAGIMLEPGASDNKILSNTITCAPNKNCLTVDVTPKVAEQNTITGNLP